MQAARKPNFVLDDHSSRPCLAAWLKQPTRGFRSVAYAAHDALQPCRSGPLRDPVRRGTKISLPIWSCSVWGLPCHDCYQPRGGLLPHPFTLTAGRVHGFCPLRNKPNSLRRFAFCCTGRTYALKRKPRTLSGTLPCGVRTFLPLRTANRRRQRSSSRLHSYSLQGTAGREQKRQDGTGGDAIA